MKVINVSSLDVIESSGDKVIALGLFESMHRGHRQLIENCVQSAKKHRALACVVTVSKPVNKSGNQIFGLDHRLEQMAKYGIDLVIVIEMNDVVRESSGEQFINFLKLLNPLQIICGADYRFGHLGSGDVNLLQKHFVLDVQEFCNLDDKKVSTSAIKLSLLAGNIAHANSLLGYNYYIKGIVEQGKQLGRTIGVPTANVYPKISPLATGVYLTKTTILNNHYRSITNIGYNPTTGDERLSIETYIGNGFSEDIYGQEIKVEMIEKIRDEIKFNSLDELVERLHADIKYMEESNYENC